MRIRKLEKKTFSYSLWQRQSARIPLQCTVWGCWAEPEKKQCWSYLWLTVSKKNPSGVRITARAAGHTWVSTSETHEQRVEVCSLYCGDVHNAYGLQPCWAGFVILHLRAGHLIWGSHLSSLSSQWIRADTSSLWFIRSIFDVNLWMQWLSL